MEYAADIWDPITKIPLNNLKEYNAGQPDGSTMISTDTAPPQLW